LLIEIFFSWSSKYEKNKKLDEKMNRKIKILMKIENYKEGIIVRRINRFTVKVKIKNKIVLAHLNNTGRLEELVKEGKVGLFLPIEKSKKLRFRLSMIKESKNTFSIIDTSLQMKAFEAALKKNYISWFKVAKILRRNFRINDSLIDYLIEYKNRKYIVEVKSAVMKRRSFAMYPDCPSIRGQKHIKELINNPTNSIILFIAAMKNINAFSPNKEADTKIYELLKIAKRKGVKIKAIQIYFDKSINSIILKNDELPIKLS
jgi:sugar fermentation stimulation protein A